MQAQLYDQRMPGNRSRLVPEPEMNEATQARDQIEHHKKDNIIGGCLAIEAESFLNQKEEQCNIQAGAAKRHSNLALLVAISERRAPEPEPRIFRPLQAE